MSFFSSIGNFFTQDIPNFFTNDIPNFVTNTIPNKIGDVFHTVDQSVFTPIKNTVGSIISTVHQDAVDIRKDVKDTVNNVIGAYENTAGKGLDTLAGVGNNLGNSLSMPLLVVGAAIGALVLLKK